jgi:hypothetical protein
VEVKRKQKQAVGPVRPVEQTHTVGKKKGAGQTRVDFVLVTAENN